jgi:hypothetical protein
LSFGSLKNLIFCGRDDPGLRGIFSIHFIR